MIDPDSCMQPVSGLPATPEFESDLQVILNRAIHRREAGWSQNDIDDLNDQECAKQDGRWRLQRAFAERHPGCSPDPQRFDTLDLEPGEINQLATTAGNATHAADPIEVAHVIERLRIDGRKTSIKASAVIMIEGQLPEAPHSMALPN